MKKSHIVFGIICSILVIIVMPFILIEPYPVWNPLFGLVGWLVIFSFIYGGYLYFQKRSKRITKTT